MDSAAVIVYLCEQEKHWTCLVMTVLWTVQIRDFATNRYKKLEKLKYYYFFLRIRMSAYLKISTMK